MRRPAVSEGNSACARLRGSNDKSKEDPLKATKTNSERKKLRENGTEPMLDTSGTGSVTPHRTQPTTNKRSPRQLDDFEGIDASTFAKLEANDARSIWKRLLTNAGLPASQVSKTDRAAPG